MSGITKEQKKLVRDFSSNCDYNPKPHEILPPGDADVSKFCPFLIFHILPWSWIFQHGTQGDKIVIAMVGLPARGKTYIAHKLQVLICWWLNPKYTFGYNVEYSTDVSSDISASSMVLYARFSMLETTGDDYMVHNSHINGSIPVTRKARRHVRWCDLLRWDSWLDGCSRYNFSHLSCCMLSFCSSL